MKQLGWKMLEGFEPLVIASGTPYVTVTQNGVSFNKSVIEKLEKTRFIQLFIDRDGMRFAIAACDENDANALKFYRNRNISDGVRINNSDLRETLLGLAGGNPPERFRVKGVYQRTARAIIFDFSITEPIRSPNKRGKEDSRQ